MTRSILNFDYSRDTRSLGVGVFVKTATLYYLVTFRRQTLAIILCFGVATFVGSLFALLTLVSES
jgi:hypothetical protein